MPPKSKMQPIDRPLSRAYLREFSGWSTAHSPGLSEPTSLRKMENCQVTREGALAVRPGLRSAFEKSNWSVNIGAGTLVGSFESFYAADGVKCILFAVRSPSNNTVSFRVGRYNAATHQYTVQTLAQAGFAGEVTITLSANTRYMRYMQIDNKIYALADSSSEADSTVIFYVGATRRVVKPVTVSIPKTDDIRYGLVYTPAPGWYVNSGTNGGPTTVPGKFTYPQGTTEEDPNDPLSGPLVPMFTFMGSSSARWTLGFFFTFENEFGESAPSEMMRLLVKRPPSQWLMNKPGPGPSMSLNGWPDPFLPTTYPEESADQLVAVLPQAVYTGAVNQKATKWNLYMAYWSNQAGPVVEASLVGSKEITGNSANTERWIRITPQLPITNVSHTLPSTQDVDNYTVPPRAGQGLVAADRMILVDDLRDAAVVRWTSNQAGEYSNFTPERGGGLKTLSSGNMLRPVSVKLWQNPQSVDTIVILCQGVDGYSTSYYMAPASISGQTGSTSIMGFEETTATPGTVAAYGVDVVNQALYHPLDDQLMKSTASNYNINHKSMTELIANKWVELRNKDLIVSAELNNLIYYVVHNPDGEALSAGHRGNEVWVLDVGGPTPVWSRYLIQAQSLHKIEIGGKVYMAVIRANGIFVLDPQQPFDEIRTTSTAWNTAGIPWSMETNIQGANRAHDAWANLQQLNITLGNFSGKMKYGLKGIDRHGMPIEMSKIITDLRATDYKARLMPWDLEDFLLVRRDMKEWTLFASSVTEGSTVQRSFGQINLVQYRYTPVSVNVGYEFGSIETFEYGRSTALVTADAAYPNGVPTPYVDFSRE